MLSLLAGVTLSFTVSSLYVLTIYILKPRGPINRNDAKVIKTRMITVTALSLAVTASLPSFLSLISGTSANVTWKQLGLVPHFVDITRVLLLVMALFVGPIFDSLVNSDVLILRDFYNEVTTLQGVRDLIFAPLTEEVMYTSTITTILLQVPEVTTKLLILLPPTFFGIAHVHHAFELYISNAAPLPTIIASTAFQMCFTTLFGIFTNFVFLRQGSLWGCVIAHSFCNFMGVPQMNVSTERFRYWRHTYYLLLVVGVYAFKSLLFPLTESSNAIIPW